MMDMYAEYIIKPKVNGKTSLFRLAVILATAILVYVTLILCQDNGLMAIMPICVAAISWAGYRAYLMFSIEYEYIVTNGELDVDRIIARRGRKRVVNIKTNAYELIAPYDEAHKSEYESGEFAKTFDIRSSDKAEAWFIIANLRDTGRIRLLFEPTPKMLYIFSQYLPRQMAVRYTPSAEEEDTF